MFSKNFVCNVPTIFLLTFVVTLNWTNGEKILFFFPTGTFSHRHSIMPMVTALADRGHNVTIISAHQIKPSERHPNINDLYSKTMGELAKSHYHVDRLTERLHNREELLYSTYNEVNVEACRVILNSPDDPALHYLVHEAQFDLVVQNIVLGDCGLILASRYGSKLIISASTPWLTFFHDAFGFPDEPSWIPDQTHAFRYPMGMLDRLKNSGLSLYWFLKRKFEVYPQLEKLMKETYNLENHEVPSLLEVQRSASLIFVLSHFTTDFPRSLPPMVVNIGGMQCFEKYEPLTGEFKDHLDKAVKGAVLIAFGSTINPATIPQQFKLQFFQLMEQFPEILFIWRWDGDLPPNRPTNLIVSKWLPQFQILAHKNLKAFISHAGLNSVTEATFNGVPVILMPLFADQDYNAYRVEATEVGIRIEARELTTTVLVNALRQILTNPKYNRNMKRLSAMMKDRPPGLNPIEAGVYWTEFVLRHDDTSPLRPLRYLNWFERRQLDIFLVLLLSLSTIIATVFLTCFYSCKKISFLRDSRLKKVQSTNGGGGGGGAKGGGIKGSAKSKKNN